MVYVLIHTQHRITVVNECATILYMIQYDTGYVMLRINTLDDDRSPFIPTRGTAIGCDVPEHYIMHIRPG